MSIITLTTDFGTADEYAGIMKGVILSLNPSAVIVDITHHIDPQDLVQAAYTIYSSYGYFPQGTVHAVIVDPAVGSDRKIIAFKKTGHIFLAPDNGVLTLLINKGNINSIASIDNTSYFLDPVSHTFHGRDIFAPVSAHLSMGVPIKKLGTSVAQKNLMCLSIREPYFSDNGELVGSIVSIDHFGNLITNKNAAVIASVLNHLIVIDFPRLLIIRRVHCRTLFEVLGFDIGIVLVFYLFCNSSGHKGTKTLKI